MLAVARLGAIVAPAFSGYGSAPLAERLRLAGARVLVTADGMMRRGRPSVMLATALAATEMTKVETVVVVSRLGDALPAHPVIVPWQTVADRADPADAVEAAEVETFDTETPWLLAFTSGSSGRPKGAVHTHGGLPYNLMLELGLTADVRAGRPLFLAQRHGMARGTDGRRRPAHAGRDRRPVRRGDGLPRAESALEAHRFAPRHTLGDWSPTTARMLAAAGEQWVEPFALDSLRIMGSAGEPWTMPAWRWIHRHVGRGRVPIINCSGGTEIAGMILSTYANVATPGGQLLGAGVGYGRSCCRRGRRAGGRHRRRAGAREELAQHDAGAVARTGRYIESYWSTLPGLWVQGDRATRLRGRDVRDPRPVRRCPQGRRKACRSGRGSNRLATEHDRRGRGSGHRRTRIRTKGEVAGVVVVQSSAP